MRRLVVEKVSELIKKPAVRAAGPAAGRAAVHGVKEFLKKFPQEYAEGRKKR